MYWLNPRKGPLFFFTLLITITIISNRIIVINSRMVMFFDIYKLLICDERNIGAGS